MFGFHQDVLFDFTEFQQQFSPNEEGHTVSYQLNAIPIKPGSLLITKLIFPQVVKNAHLHVPSTGTIDGKSACYAIDDRQGNIYGPNLIGTLDYQNGTLSFTFKNSSPLADQLKWQSDNPDRVSMFRSGVVAIYESEDKSGHSNSSSE